MKKQFCKYCGKEIKVGEPFYAMQGKVFCSHMEFTFWVTDPRVAAMTEPLPHPPKRRD